MPVHIGEAQLVGDFSRYTSRFSFIELETEPGHVPSKARLRACAEQAPKGFVFSLVLPTAVSSLESGAHVLDAYERAASVARLLDSKWWVVRTPAQVRPTRRSREQLAELFARLRDGGRRIAWEPRGLWEDSVAFDTAKELDVHLVQDIAQQAPPHAPTLYSRILALGRGSRVGLGLAAAVAERIRGFDEAFIVVEGRGAEELQRAVLASADEPHDATDVPPLAGPVRSPLVGRLSDEDDDDELEDEATTDGASGDDLEDEGEDDIDDEDDDDEDDDDDDELDVDKDLEGDDDLDDDDDDDDADDDDEDDLEGDDDLDDDDDDADGDDEDPDDDGEPRPPKGRA